MVQNLGGKETIKQAYKFGFGCTVNTSISPDGTTKVVRYFFINLKTIKKIKPI